MTHKDQGRFFAKHPPNMQVNEDLKKEILEQAKNNRISCKKAEEISRELGFSLEETGRTIDMVDIKITKCQLGLFGYGEEHQKIVQPAKDITPDLKKRIQSAMNDKKLSCAAAWEIAGSLNISRTKVASACEAMGIKIKPCQLGAF